MTTIQNYDDGDTSSSSSRKRFKTFDNGGVAPWSDLHHDVLFLVMMRLGVVDFLAFNTVCKSWRSLALSNRNSFMTSRPPMLISFEPPNNNQDSYCRLKDIEGRIFKTIIPHSNDRKYFGLTCGYMIFFEWVTRDFWLVNPITRHELHFPAYPLYIGSGEIGIKAILAFSPSIYGQVFVVLHKKISFCIAGKRGWNHVSSTRPILDLRAFKGKIYTLHTGCSLCELRLNPNRKRKWTLLEVSNLQNLEFYEPQLVSLNENLYVINRSSAPPKEILKLDFGKKKWVSPEKTLEEYAFFFGYFYTAAFKLESCAEPRTQYKCYEYKRGKDESRKYLFLYNQGLWYFPHDCLNVNLLDEQ